MSDELDAITEATRRYIEKNRSTLVDGIFTQSPFAKWFRRQELLDLGHRREHMMTCTLEEALAREELRDCPLCWPKIAAKLLENGR